MNLSLPQTPRRTGAFTLIELLVVIGIIAVLASLLLPMLSRSRKAAQKLKTQQTLQTLSAGLEAYQQVWGAYPVFDNAITTSSFDDDGNGVGNRMYVDSGPRALYSGLIHRYALRKGSQSYGPFVNVDNVRVDRVNFWIIDENGKPILYVPAAAAKPDIHKMITAAVPGFCGDGQMGAGGTAAVHSDVSPYYDHRAAVQKVSTAGIPSIAPAMLIKPEPMQMLLGDINRSGTIDNNEQPATTAPYLLWASGPDGYFGFSPSLTLPGPGQAISPDLTTDDVANFDFPPQFVRK